MGIYLKVGFMLDIHIVFLFYELHIGYYSHSVICNLIVISKEISHC